MVEPLTLQVRNKLEDIAPATEAAEAWLGAFEGPSTVTFFVSLAIEELVTNCIKYGYDDNDEHTISILLSFSDQVVTMEVVDDGHAFNPLEAPPPNLSDEIDDRPIGGLGIHLLREMGDGVTYERRDGTNRLTLIKRVS